MSIFSGLNAAANAASQVAGAVGSVAAAGNAVNVAANAIAGAVGALLNPGGASGRHLDASFFSGSGGQQVHQTNWFCVNVLGLGNTLEFYVQSLPLPTDSNEVVEVHYGNSHANVAGKYSAENGTLTFVDDLTNVVVSQLRAWRNLVYNKNTGAMGFVSEYKKDVLITQYGPKGGTIRSWKMWGAWPTQVNWGNLDYSGSEVTKVECTLAYDKLQEQ